MMLSTVLLLPWGHALLVLFVIGWSAVMSSHYEMTNFTLPKLSDPVVLVASSPRPFEWKHLDLKQNGACGFTKCFFQSSLDENEGYLVARSEKGARYKDKLLRIWERAQQLSKEPHQGRHFLLEPPVEVPFPSLSILKKMNARAHGPGRTNKRYFGNHKWYNETMLRNAGASIVIQKVRVAPTPNLICRCYFFHKKKPKGRFKLDDLSATKEEFRSAIKDKQSFLETYIEELKNLIRLLADGYFARLYYDFQFLLDSKGKIYHIDMDRLESTGYRFPRQEGANACLSGALTKVAKIVNGESNNTNNTNAAHDRLLNETVNGLLNLVKVAKPKK